MPQYFLSDEDVAILREIANRVRKGRINDRVWSPGPPQILPSNEVYFAAVPDGGIPAREDTTAGKATCQIYRLEPDDPEDPESAYSIVECEGNTQDVFNIYPVKWYYAEGRTQYVRIGRDKFGRWLCEKPPYRLKCQSAADIAPTESGTVNIFINGEDSGETLTAHLNWMHNDQQIPEGADMVIQFYEDENKWIIELAECEQGA